MAHTPDQDAAAVQAYETMADQVRRRRVLERALVNPNPVLP